jgi:LmbE family N-acetylglucosaminyl deacetylase
MDDEVIGCGGTVARHTDAGAHVAVVYLTDGSSGHPLVYRARGEERARAEQELIVRRKEEARLAQEVLGVRTLHFLDAIDTRLTADSSTVLKLRKVLLEERPNLVYLPHFLELHPDHRVASALLLEAVQGTGLDFHCHAFEVWTALIPNRSVRIDSTMERKQRAMKHYRSQLEDRVDLLHAMTGLAAYRSSAKARSGSRFVETFCSMSLDEYREASAAFRGGEAPFPKEA